jgi:hypothetical protein
MLMKRICLVAFLATLAMPSISQGAPKASYNPTTGEITIVNDSNSALAHVTVLSASGKLVDTPSSLASIPGAVKDDADLPFAFTYLNFPVGEFSTGLTGKIGITRPDYTFEYRIGSLRNPLIRGEFWFGYFPPDPDPDPFPEPSSLALLGFGGVGLLQFRRRG